MPSQPSIDALPSTSIEVLTVRVDGQLTAEGFERELTACGARMRPPAVYALVFDVLAMKGYEPAVRETYIRWHRANAARIRRVAVVTDRGMWRLVVATIGLATGGMTRAFERPEEATVWARGG